MPEWVENCSLCTPFNDTGCRGDCKWTPSSMCIPHYMVHCVDFIYADSCDMCNNVTLMASASGCEASDGDCTWTPENTCEKTCNFKGKDSNPIPVSMVQPSWWYGTLTMSVAP